MSPQPKEEFADDFHGQDAGRQERLRRLVQQTPKDRVADMNQRVNEPSKCEYCGSTWFTEQTYNQYAASAYSAAPGGDIQPITLMPMPIRVCLCGMPMAPNLGGASLGGRTPNESVSSFNGSLRVAAAKILARAGVMPPPTAAALADSDTVKRLIAAVEQRMSKVESLPSDNELIMQLQARLAGIERELAGSKAEAKAVVKGAPAKVRAKAADKTPPAVEG